MATRLLAFGVTGITVYAWWSSQISKEKAIGICLLTITLTYMRMQAADPYGTFHYRLNWVPGQSPTERPKTEWLNLGYWKDTDVFPHACEALALKLSRAAGYSAGGHILDVGYGSGESLVMHLTHPDVPRPASLTGITSLREHVERSQERVEQLLEDTPGPHPLVDLHHADAVFRSSAPPDHPLDPKAKTPAFSAILALDCAYHFRTRKEFLQQSLHRLAPGGRIGLADLSFDFPSSKDGWRTRLVSLLGVIPHENIVRPDEYVQMMEDIGFENVKLEDISSDVFPGFFNFLKSRGSLWPVFVVGMQGLVGLGMKFVIVTAEAPMQKHLS